MEKIILLSLSIILAMPFFVSCSNDDEMLPPIPFASDPKPDIDFKGSDSKTIQNALQGSWWLTKIGNIEYKEEESTCLIFRGGKIAFQAGPSVDTINEPKWYDLVWMEKETETGEKIYSFYARPDNPESTYVMYYTPYRIENNILYMDNFGQEGYICYSLVLKTTPAP